MPELQGLCWCRLGVYNFFAFYWPCRNYKRVKLTSMIICFLTCIHMNCSYEWFDFKDRIIFLQRMIYLTVDCIERTLGVIQTSLFLFFIARTNTWKQAVMYICIKGNDFASFYGISIVSLNCFDSAYWFISRLFFYYLCY